LFRSHLKRLNSILAGQPLPSELLQQSLYSSSSTSYSYAFSWKAPSKANPINVSRILPVPSSSSFTSASRSWNQMAQEGDLLNALAAAD